MEHNEEHGERLHALAHEAHDLSNGRMAELNKQIARRFGRLFAVEMMQRERRTTEDLLLWAVEQQQVKTVEWLLSKGGAEPLSLIHI
eukprot:3114157-Prymnesium_polylepis.1